MRSKENANVLLWPFILCTDDAAILVLCTRPMGVSEKTEKEKARAG